MTIISTAVGKNPLEESEQGKDSKAKKGDLSICFFLFMLKKKKPNSIGFFKTYQGTQILKVNKNQFK